MHKLKNKTLKFKQIKGDNMIILKRIWNFDKQDMKHVGWLFKQLIVSFFKGDLDGVEESWMFIKLHCYYDSKKID